MYTKLKTNLRLCIQRLKLLAKKKTELTQKARPEIASYIYNDKVDRAKIRVEHIIREDYLVEAYEILEMYCDLLLTRFSLIEQMKTLDEGLIEPISSLIWAAPRIEGCTELKIVAELLAKKYGKVFAQAAKENSLKRVNEKLIQKLSIEAPPKILMERYLVEIAKSQDIKYEPDLEAMGKGPGGSGSGGGGGGFTDKPLIGFVDFPDITNPPLIPAPGPDQDKIGFRGDLFDVGVDPLDQAPYGAQQWTQPPHPNFSAYSKSKQDNQQPPVPSSQPSIRPPTPPPSYPADLDVDQLPAVPTTLPYIPDSSSGNTNKKGGKKQDDEDDIDFDALTKRFEALKKKR